MTLDSKSTNTDSHTTESKDLLGGEIEIYFKEQWQDKQLRFFAYIESAKSDISMDVGTREYHYIIQVVHTEQEKKGWHENDILWTAIYITSLVATFIPVGV